MQDGDGIGDSRLDVAGVSLDQLTLRKRYKERLQCPRSCTTFRISQLFARDVLHMHQIYVTTWIIFAIQQPVQDDSCIKNVLMPVGLVLVAVATTAAAKQCLFLRSQDQT